MLRPGSRATALASIGAAGVAAVAVVTTAACGSSGSSTGNGTTISVAPSILAPADVLDDASQVSVYVFDVSGDLACDATTGLVTSGGQRVSVAAMTPNTNLTRGSCAAAGATFCGQLTLTQSSTDRLFQVVAYASDNTELGDGCARATVKDNTLALPLIKMVRLVAPSVCGDGKIEATEQCEKSLATDAALCDSSCHTIEQHLSIGLDTDGQTQTADAKSDPAFLWPAASDDSGHFLGLFTDHPSGHTQVGLRALSENFAPVTDQGATIQNAYIWLPNDENFPPGLTAGNQSLPAAIFTQTPQPRYYVAFADDANIGSGDGSLDIHFRSMDVELVADQAADSAIGVNGTDGVGETNPQTSPAIALGANEQVFIAWTDSTSGKIIGRTIDPTSGNARGAQTEISQGTGNDGVSLAALPASSGGGYVATWISNGNAVLRKIASDGTTSGNVIAVTSGGRAAHARIASLPDGRFAVAYAANGGSTGSDIFVQRYTASLTAVPGDAQTTVNDVVTVGDQTEPAITALTADGGSFGIAWAETASGSIHARFVGGSSGYLFNNVDAQSDEFSASIATGHQRDQPSIVSGGAQHAVAIGWRDNGPGGTPGIYARRFPLPQ